MGTPCFSRIVIGGGLFGTYSALVLGRMGHSVLLVERDSRLLNRASYVNQARLHTGLHYPRSIITAQEALGAYERFRERFPAAVRDFRQVYAVARHGSKTTAGEFERFIGRLGIPSESVDPARWFLPNVVDAAWIVEEPTFVARVLRRILESDVAACEGITLALNTEVVDARVDDRAVRVTLSTGSLTVPTRTRTMFMRCWELPPFHSPTNWLRSYLGGWRHHSLIPV